MTLSINGLHDTVLTAPDYHKGLLLTKKLYLKNGAGMQMCHLQVPTYMCNKRHLWPLVVRSVFKRAVQPEVLKGH